jgi:hypothetical protein
MASEVASAQPATTSTATAGEVWLLFPVDAHLGLAGDHSEQNHALRGR